MFEILKLWSNDVNPYKHLINIIEENLAVIKKNMKISEHELGYLISEVLDKILQNKEILQIDFNVLN